MALFPRRNCSGANGFAAERTQQRRHRPRHPLMSPSLTVTAYPLFNPPNLLSDKSHSEWSKAEAEEYSRWLIRSIDDRTDDLLHYFSLDASAWAPRTLLVRLGTLVAERLGEAEFSEGKPDGTRSLTNAGHALAADLGLLTARLLLQASGGTIRWEVVRKPKSDISYNLPVLTGFSNKLTLDPVGGAVAEAQAVLAGRRSVDAWARILDYWGSRAVG